MREWSYKWLPIIFGCHCREDRSFYYKGEKFPICARCTGELVGIIVSIITCFFFQLNLFLSVLILLPMIVDGIVQMKTSYVSNNKRRFITGFFFGYGFFMIFVTTSIMTFEFGKSLVK